MCSPKNKVRLENISKITAFQNTSVEINVMTPEVEKMQIWLRGLTVNLSKCLILIMVNLFWLL